MTKGLTQFDMFVTIENAQITFMVFRLLLVQYLEQCLVNNSFKREPVLLKDLSDRERDKWLAKA